MFKPIRSAATMRVWPSVVLGLLLAALYDPHHPAAQRGASQPLPPTVTPQSYPAEQVRAGQPLYVARCAFCHGRDAAGGESGPDLTRSMLVAEDVRGDKIGPTVR